jgi:outer membrane lipopolysaccharide assembly protein LptE/RlpB
MKLYRSLRALAWQSNYYKTLPLAILLLSLSSCGFHLRGSPSANYKFPFKKVYIDCGNVVICSNLVTAINTQELSKIVTNPESANATIKLVKEETSRDAQSFTSIAGFQHID